MDSIIKTSFTKAFALLFMLGIMLYANKPRGKIFNKDIVFLLFRYIILNTIFIGVYYFYCDDERDWNYGVNSEYNENPLFYSMYHTFMVSTTIGDIHPMSMKARSITLIQAMLDFYLFGNIIYYLSYKEVNGF